MLEGVEGCSGKGYSKKESQQLASKLTLEKLRKEPQFIDQVFAAKTERTKMEEEPVENVPSTEENNDFIITNPEVEANAEAAVQTLERQKSKRDRRAPMYRQTEKHSPWQTKRKPMQKSSTSATYPPRRRAARTSSLPQRQPLSQNKK